MIGAPSYSNADAYVEPNESDDFFEPATSSTMNKSHDANFFEQVAQEENLSEISETSGNSCSKEESPWLLTYSLPNLPVCVKEEIKECISQNCPVSFSMRRKIGRVLFQSISEKTLYPTGLEYKSVCLELVKKYPFLADKNPTNPVGTWIKSLRQRFRDSRRPLVNNPQVAAMKMKFGLSKQQKRGKQQPENESTAKRRNSSVLIPGDVAVICDSDDEDERSLQCHIKRMQDESAKRCIDLIILEDRMKRSFLHRRKEVCSGVLLVVDLLKKYPALRFPCCIFSEFKRILGGDPSKKLMKIDPKIWTFVCSKLKNIPETFLQFVGTDERKKAFLCLPMIFREKLDLFVEIDRVMDFSSVNVKTPYPQLRASTNAAGYALFIEKQLLCIVEDDIESAVLLMLCCYWVFDVCFPKSLVKSLSLLAHLLDIPCETAKNISVQNFLSQL